MYKKYSNADVLEMLVNACFDLVHNPTKKKTQKQLEELEKEVLEQKQLEELEKEVLERMNNK